MAPDQPGTHLPSSGVSAIAEPSSFPPAWHRRTIWGAMPSSTTPRKAVDVNRVFTGEQQADLRRLLGASSAGHLLPKLAEAAERYQRTERETIEQAERRRAIARKHVATLARVLGDIDRLQKGLDAATALIPEASEQQYLNWIRTVEPLGGIDTAAAIGKRMDSVQDAVRIARPVFGAWRKRAGDDMRRRRGRKVGDRHWLNQWIVIRLAK
jgi:hypothetical protein